MLNDEIENLTGDYINTIIEPYSIETFDPEKFYFTSVKSYVYFKNNETSFDEYEKELPDITNYFLNKGNMEEKLNERFENLSNNLQQLINNSPKSETDMIIYRGISCPLDLKVGDIYNHKTFIWGSFHYRFAIKFTYDTSRCYKNGQSYNDFNSTNYNSKGVLLKILVPKNTSYLERIIRIDYAPHDAKSEIIINPGKLLVEGINDRLIIVKYLS